MKSQSLVPSAHTVANDLISSFTNTMLDQFAICVYVYVCVKFEAPF